jgi:hypothetical protein
MLSAEWVPIKSTRWCCALTQVGCPSRGIDLSMHYSSLALSNLCCAVIARCLTQPARPAPDSMFRAPSSPMRCGRSCWRARLRRFWSSGLVSHGLRVQPVCRARRITSTVDELRPPKQARSNVPNHSVTDIRVYTRSVRYTRVPESPSESLDPGL